MDSSRGKNRNQHWKGNNDHLFSLVFGTSRMDMREFLCSTSSMKCDNLIPLKDYFYSVVHWVNPRYRTPSEMIKLVFDRDPVTLKSLFDAEQGLATLTGYKLRLPNGFSMFAFRLKMRNGDHLMAAGM